jgi:hypothetical protein
VRKVRLLQVSDLASLTLAKAQSGAATCAPSAGDLGLRCGSHNGLQALTLSVLTRKRK